LQNLGVNVAGTIDDVTGKVIAIGAHVFGRMLPLKSANAT